MFFFTKKTTWPDELSKETTCENYCQKYAAAKPNRPFLYKNPGVPRKAAAFVLSPVS
jgi:hypothetical protein